MILHDIKDAFFSEKFWLPPNVTWAAFEDENYNMPQIRDLWLGIPLAFVILLFRKFWERCIAAPIGRMRGVSDKPAKQPAKNSTLEKAFKKHKRMIPDDADLEALSKQTDMTVRQIQRWWRLRRSSDKPTEMQRLGESSFRSLMYFILFGMGVYNLWGEPYIWDTKHCWYNYPMQNVTSAHLWYFSMEIGFYLSLLMSAGTDNKQKDFWEMMIHHVTSLAMFFISWLGNFVRVAVLTVTLHDCADPLLDAAKVAKYLNPKYKRLPDIIFVIFTVAWLFSRLIALPLWTGRTSYFEGQEIIGQYYPAYWLLFSLYALLQILHFYWFTFIVRVIYHYIILKKELRDTRSDTEDSDSEEDKKKEKTPHMNGSNSKINGTNGSIRNANNNSK